MFKNNKYTKWYNQIIEKRKNNKITDNSYTEKHHIIPRSLGGSNKKENLIELTPREHFICHRLLVKMTDGTDKVKMSYAIRMMIRHENQYQTRYKVTSRVYEQIITETRKIISESRKKENNHFYGKKHSDKSKKLMKEKRKLQKPPMLNKTHSTITKEKLREANKKQFKDPWQIELRRHKCNKIKGMKIYHKDGINRYFIENTQPAGWSLGRTKKEEL